MESDLVHRGISIIVTRGGMFAFEVEDEKIEVESFAAATKRIDAIMSRKRKKVSTRCYFVTSGYGFNYEIKAGEYCGIHAGWKSHTYKVDGDDERQSAGNWEKVTAYPDHETASRVVELKREIERLESEVRSLGYYFGKVPEKFDERVDLEQKVSAYLAGEGTRP